MIEDKCIKIGDKLPEFSLVATDHKIYSTKDFKDKDILIVMFTCNHCPYVQAYEERLITLQNEYKDKGVQFIAINSNDEKYYPEDSFEGMINRANIKNYSFPYLRDETQEIAKSFGATFTPEIFLFDKNRRMQYHGRVDDNWQEPNKVRKSNLKDAIEAILTGQEVNRANTQAIGCSVKWKK